MSALNATYPSSNTTVSTGGVAALYHQCGGINWTGPTECETGSYCKDQNPFYYQCVSVEEGTYTNATATGSNGKPIQECQLVFKYLTCVLNKNSRLHQHTPRLWPRLGPAHNACHHHRVHIRRCHQCHSHWHSRGRWRLL